MPEYRWGIFLAEPEPDRRINFGDHKGQPAWQDVPGEYRGTLRRLIVTQGDTEPASVEQQRHLGPHVPLALRPPQPLPGERRGRAATCGPWSISSTRTSAATGARSRRRCSSAAPGDADKPRILGAFNEQTPDWLSFFMFCFFTDRDGKYQLASLAESGFDPLSRTCRFMLTEEAHHMFVGESGVRPHRAAHLRDHARARRPTTCARTAASTCRPSRSTSTSTARCRSTSSAPRCPPTPPTSTPWGSRAASRRRRRTTITGSRTPTYPVAQLAGDRIGTREEPALVSLNERLRDDYVADCQRGRHPLEPGHPEPRHRRRAHAAPPRLPPRHRRLRRTSRSRRTAACSARRSGTRATTSGCPPPRTRRTSAA